MGQLAPLWGYFQMRRGSICQEQEVIQRRFAVRIFLSSVTTCASGSQYVRNVHARTANSQLLSYA